MAKSKTIKIKPLDGVGWHDVVTDKALMDLVRKAMEPAIEAAIIRAAMIGKQFALVALKEGERRAELAAKDGG